MNSTSDPHPDSPVKVLFRLEPDEDGYPPVRAETLWATAETLPEIRDEGSTVF